MRAKPNPTVFVFLALALSGCTAVGGDRLPTLTQLDIPDRYSAPSPGQVSPDPAGLDLVSLERCWSWLGDPLLGELVDYDQGVAAPALSAETKAAIARRYIGLRARQARIANARTYLASQLENLEVARFRAEAGLVTTRDALQADADSALVAATIPALEAQNASDAARIAVLSGQAPATLRDRLSAPGPIPAEPAQVAIGRPSDLLTQRADLKTATARLRTIGTGEKSRVAYRAAILAALEEVENGQTASDAAAARIQSLAVAAEKAGVFASLARRQYRDGLADYSVLSGAEAALLAARDALAEARAARVSASIDLCVALGGGGPLVQAAPLVKPASLSKTGG